MMIILILLMCLSCVHGSVTFTTSLVKNTANVCFKFKPRHYNVKDYVDIVNFTLTLLEQRNDWSAHQNMLKVKEEIHKVLTIPKRDCKEFYDSGFRRDGIYRISPTGITSAFSAYCDMKNGGWTVIQRRKYGDVRFDRKWSSYTEGFGDLNGDHWLGLNSVHELTKDSPNQISFRFQMADNHNNANAIYHGFYIDNEVADFRMHVKPNAIYNSIIKPYIQDNGFYYHNNMKFSTLDRDNDEATGSCSKSHNNAGFWFRACYTLGWVNGDFNRMYIYNKKAYKLSRSEIKIRRE